MNTRFNRFRNCESGNIAIMGTFAMIPILGLVVGGIEFAEIDKITRSMQHAADTAVIAAFDAPELTWSKRIRRANGFFDANFLFPERVGGVSKKLSGKQTKRRVVLNYSASAKIDSLFGEMSPFFDGTISVQASALYVEGSGKHPRLISSGKSSAKRGL